jgi:Mn-dependent DtxR family transcriptional regulator
MPKKPAPKLTENAEDYLERIFELTETQGYARISDLAEELKLSKASASGMIQRLAKQGLVKNQRYRGFTLSADGLAVAKAIRQRHEVLRDFFNLLGVSTKTAKTDIEGIEHHVSAETLTKLKTLIEKMKRRKA